MSSETGIWLLTGNPGSGKSLFAVSLAVEAIQRGDRPVFTNITGLTIPGVRPLPANADWRELPDRSLVIFDESQDIEDETGHRPYAATGQAGLVRDGRLAELRQHRKREFLLVFVSQHPTFVHHEVRKICDTHKHFLRVMGLSRSTVYTFSGSYCLSPEKPEERRRGDKEFWRFPKKLFALYHSATAHHFRFRLPRKVALIAIAGAFVAALGVYFLLGRVGIGDSSVLVEEARANADALAGDAEPGRGAPQFKPGSEEFAWTKVERVTPMAGCAVLTESCRCWDAEGLQLALSRVKCLEVAFGALPVHFVRDENSSSGDASAEEESSSKAVPGASSEPSVVGPTPPAMGAVWGK